MPRLGVLWRNLMQRKRVERDLDDELRAAFDLLVGEHLQAGMDPDSARRAATLQLGRMDAIKTQVRTERGGAGLDILWHDVTFGARLLRRNPLFAFTAVMSLAIGIGATTTMFSLVNALLVREVAVASPGQLIEVGRVTQFGRGTAYSYPAYEKLRDENTAFSGLLALSKNTMPGSTAPGVRRGDVWSRETFSTCSA